MMECKQCGAPLRPNARFCNVCGARQDLLEEVMPETPATTTGAMSEASDLPPVGEMNADDSEGRPKRRPRVPRAADGENAIEGQEQSAQSMMTSVPGEGDAAGASEDSADSALKSMDEDDAAPTADEIIAEPASMPAPETDAPHSTEGENMELAPHIVSNDDETARVAESAQPMNVTSAASVSREDLSWEDAPTVEQSAISGSSPSWLNGGPVGVTSVSVTMPPLSQLARSAGAASPPPQRTASDEPMSEDDAESTQRPDPLPWPLPMSIIVGGRYRVESLVHAAPDEPEGENIYRVTDLQGYERCWSCGAEYGMTGASDRFCRECGADMLAREFLMYERHSAAQEDNADDAPADLDAETLPEIDLGTGKSARVTDGDVRSFIQGTRAYRVMPRVVEPSPFPHGARLVAAVATDVGVTRPGERNEDSQGLLMLNLIYDSHAQPLGLAIVADGLGGHVNGQDASRLVVRTVTNQILRSVALSLVDLPADGAATEEGLQGVLKDAVRAANVALCKANDESGADMGSTVVAALLFGGTAYVANVGDSRAYVLEDAGLRRITTDHSLVEQLIVGGFVKPEERYSHPQRNQIYRSLGDEPDMQIDIFTQKLRPGVRLLLCSDGLWEMVRDTELESVLRETKHPQEACDVLIQRANEHGGEDNISALVVEVSV